MSINEQYQNYGVIHSAKNCNVCELSESSISLNRKISKILWLTFALIALFAAYALYFRLDYIVDGLPASHSGVLMSSDKLDMTCTESDTAGRCSDKCASGYFLRGFDKDTGQAVCDTTTGCEYGDSIPLGADCDRNAIPKQPEIVTPDFSNFRGK